MKNANILEKIRKLRSGFIMTNQEIPPFLLLGHKEYTDFVITFMHRNMRPYVAVYLDMEVLKVDRENFLKVA